MTTLSNYMSRSIILLCAGIFLMTCSGRKYQAIYIYNPTPDVITISIDNDPVAVPADSLIRKMVFGGTHSVKYGNRLDSMNVTADANILVNPTRARLILNEMLYQTEYISNGKATHEDYATPVTVIMIDSLRYGGHFKVTDEVIVKGWFVNIGEKPDSHVNGEEYMRKGLQGGGSGGDPTMLSSYKLYSLDEFAAHTIPLNRDKHYIEYILNQHLHRQTDDGVVFVNVNFLMAGESQTVAGSVAKIHITNNDEIYLKDPSLYNKSEHGKILGTPYTISDCIVEFDSATVKPVSKVAMVKVEESLALKLVIQ